jgi:hypothetical protein
MLIAQFGGWYVGMAIATAILVVVVGIVASLLTLATRIADQAIIAAGDLDRVRANTMALADVHKINASALGILDGARAGRAAAGG